MPAASQSVVRVGSTLPIFWSNILSFMPVIRANWALDQMISPSISRSMAIGRGIFTLLATSRVSAVDWMYAVSSRRWYTRRI